MTNSHKALINTQNLLQDKPLMLILIMAFIARLVVMWVYPDQHFPDATAYRTIGEEIFSGSMVTNHIYMPLYPILSYITGSGWSQIIVDIFISTVSVWIIFLLSLRLFNNRMSALLSATIAAFYPHFLFYSVSGLTEIFYTFLLLLSFLLFYRKKIILAIIISILAILVRPTLDFLNPFLIVLFIRFVHGYNWRKVLGYLGVYFIAYIVIMSPWWMHQYQKYGEFVRLNLGDGIVLYSGNNPMNISGGGVGRYKGPSDMDLSIFDNITNPVLRNKAMKEASVEYIISNPGHFVKMAGVKFLRLWRLWPHTEHYQQWYIIAASLLSYGVVLFLTIGFIFRNAKKYFKDLIPIFALIMYLTLVHMITIGSIRYRFPLEPFLIIFASYFFVYFSKNIARLKIKH